jgi:carbon storage regulator
MLVLQRRIGERICIGDNIEVVVVKATKGGKVLLGVTAPKDVRVVRDDARKQEPTDRQGPKDRAVEG